MPLREDCIFEYCEIQNRAKYNLEKQKRYFCFKHTSFKQISLKKVACPYA